MTSISILIIIIFITVVISIKGFNDRAFLDRLMFMPYASKEYGEKHRFFTHLFIHSDAMHLAFNMLALYYLGGALLEMEAGTYSFGGSSEYVQVGDGFLAFFGPVFGQLHFLALYLLGGLFATLISYIRHHDNVSYRSLGASGAVSAVVFAEIFWMPEVPLKLLFIPFPIPGYVFGAIYLAFEIYADRRGNTGIAHDAHIGGAIFGVVYVLIINIDKAKEFINYVIG